MMEEFRICTVEVQAATEDLREEMSEVILNLNSQHCKVCNHYFKGFVSFTLLLTYLSIKCKNILILRCEVGLTHSSMHYRVFLIKKVMFILVYRA